MSEIDWNSMGADRPNPNPQTVVEKMTGTYKDNVGEKPMVPNLPSGPDPSPFTITGGGKGS